MFLYAVGNLSRRPRALASLLLTTLLLQYMPFAPARAARQDAQQPPALEQGKPVERELAGGQTHAYTLTLAAEQFVRLIVDQRGIDVVLALAGPDGAKLAEVDSPNGVRGPEAIKIITMVAGVYRVEVRALDKDVPAGRYEARVEELRPATEKDRRILAGERAVAEALRLRRADTADSLRQAITKYEEAITHYNAAAEAQQEALAVNNIGVVYDRLNEKQKALEYFDRAHKLFTATGDQLGRGFTLLSAAKIHIHFFGDVQQGFDLLERALAIFRAAKRPSAEAAALFEFARAYSSFNEKRKALGYLEQSLAIARAINDRGGQVQATHAIAGNYFWMGDKEKALDYFKQCLELVRTNRDRRMEAVVLNDLGLLYLSLGEKQKALEHLTESLRIAKESKNRMVEAGALHGLGQARRAMGESGKALEPYEQALAIFRAAGDHYWQHLTLHFMARSHEDLGDRKTARTLLEQSMQIARDGHIFGAELSGLHLLARFLRTDGDLEGALTHIEQAIDIVESVRGRIGTPQLRASFFETVRAFYDLKIDLLMRLRERQPPGADRAAVAFQTSERARARSLLELLAESGADIRRDADPELLGRERELHRTISLKAARLRELAGRKDVTGQAAAITLEIERLTAEVEQVQAQIRARSPRYAALMQPAPITVKDVQRMLDPDTVLLEYALGDERSYVWAVASDSFESFELPRRTEIDDAARRVYDLLTERTRAVEGETGDARRARYARADAELEGAAAALSRMVVGPVAARLNRKRVIVVADGALQYVPFAALPSPAKGARAGEPLIAGHEIVSLPSASALAALRADAVRRGKTDAKTVAVLADPVFEETDDRLKESARKNGARGKGDEAAVLRDAERAAADTAESGAGARFKRLHATGWEARQIMSLVPAGEGMLALGFDASRATATSGKLGDYRILHFATHAVVNEIHPELSGVVLSLVDEEGRPQDGFLRAHEIFNLRLSAELVVLSACRTGLGKKVEGEGLVGLTRGFMYAGAPRVLVSLWSVEDTATSALMARFYRKMLGPERLRPAAALRAAQIETWKQDKLPPYYWAAFTLQGEWR